MSPVLWVGLGGGIGSVLRFGMGRWILMREGAGFPWGTLLVNVAGCMAIGLLARMCDARVVSDETRLFLTTGLLGGFTTFSAFGLETITLAQSGHLGAAVVYVMLSVGGALAAVWVGGRLA